MGGRIDGEQLAAEAAREAEATAEEEEVDCVGGSMVFGCVD